MKPFAAFGCITGEGSLRDKSKTLGTASSKRSECIIMTDEIFVRYYEKHKNSIYSVIFNYVRSEADAGDLTQETFIKFYSCDKEFESDEHAKAWLIRVAINLCKNHIRDNKRRSFDELDENIPAPETKDYSYVMTAVLSLPEKYRIPIHLYFYENYSVKQIAAALSLNESTVKTRIKRGKEKLKSLLEKEAGHYEYRVEV